MEAEAEKIRRLIIKKRTESDSADIDMKNKEEKKIIEMITRVPIISIDDLAPFPNFLAKTAIFSPRKTNAEDNDTKDKWVRLQSPSHYKIFYNGPLLSMEEQNLYMLLIKKAEGARADESINISRYQILKDLGYKSISKAAYEWLHKAMDHLMQSNIKIVLEKSVIEHIIKTPDNKINEITMHLIDEFAYDGENYIFKINSNSLFLYSNNNYGWNSLATKLKIKQNTKPELTTWIYSFVISESKGIHSYKIDTIYEYIGSKKKRADFIKDLTNSFNTLVTLDVIRSYKINNNSTIEWDR